MKLAPGVLRIPTSTGDRDNAFLVEGDDGYTLVDVGWKRAPAAIRTALDEAGRSIQDITKIVITQRSFVRASRWRDGRVVVWLSATRGVGRGEGSSGLGFTSGW